MPGELRQRQLFLRDVFVLRILGAVKTLIRKEKGRAFPAKGVPSLFICLSRLQNGYSEH